jgi:hypothetical protein
VVAGSNDAEVLREPIRDAARRLGVPPLKWSTHWDRIIPFEEDRRWLGSETSRKRSS